MDPGPASEVVYRFLATSYLRSHLVDFNLIVRKEVTNKAIFRFRSTSDNKAGLYKHKGYASIIDKISIAEKIFVRQCLVDMKNGFNATTLYFFVIK